MAVKVKTKKYPITVRNNKGGNITINGYTNVLEGGDIEYRDENDNLILTRKTDNSLSFDPKAKVDGNPISVDQQNDVKGFLANTILKNGRDELKNQINPNTGRNYTDAEANDYIKSNLPVNPTPPPNLNPINVNRSTFATKERTKAYDSVKYPENADPNQDYIQFTILKYGSIILDPKKPTSSVSNRNTKSLKATITLPIQPGITDNNLVQWGSDELNPIQAAGAVTAFNTMPATMENAGQEFVFGLKRTNESFQDEPRTRSAIMAYFAGQAVGNQNLLSRLNGSVLNPNLELLFQGPQLRNFNFNFQLTPRTSGESIKIKKIIRYFKQAMSVQRSESEIFLSAPNVFEIKYILAEDNDKHPYLPIIKDCALTNFSVDYTPDGSYMTYADGSMTSYRLTMQFQELTPIYNDDYTNLDSDNDDYIGY